MPVLTSPYAWGMFALGLLLGIVVGSLLTNRRVWRERQRRVMDRMYSALEERRDDE